MTARTVSVGLSRLFRLVELEPGKLRVEQAVKDPLTKKWDWKPLAFATQWGEAHGALHQMQADFMDKMIERQGSFNAERYS
jgi:hypothetical protein